MNIKVGCVLYYCRKNQGLLYTKATVYGETSRSWLVLNATNDKDYRRADLKRFAIKLPKNFNGFVVGTKEDARVARWWVTHRYAVSRKVENLDPADLLKIAQAINYAPLPSKDYDLYD